MLVPVTTPRSAQSTDDCAAIRVGLAPAQAEADDEAGRRDLPDRAVRIESSASSAAPTHDHRRTDQRRVAEADPQDRSGPPAEAAMRPADGQRGERRSRRPARWCRARPGHTAGRRRSARSASRRRREPARLVVLSSRLRNTQPGSTGSAARRSTRTKATSRRAGRSQDGDARHRRPGPEHPALEQAEDQQGACRRSAAPRRRSRSGAASARPARGTCGAAPRRRSAPNGMLTKKIQRQFEEVDEEPAEGRADDGGDGPHAGHVPLHLGPLGRRSRCRR